MESSHKEKTENELYLESNELNKLMETLMGQIRMHKPQDIVRFNLHVIDVAWVSRKLYEIAVWRESNL